jgi:hypothetical protein
VEKAASFAAGIKLKLAFSVGCSDLLAEGDTGIYRLPVIGKMRFIIQ